MKSKAILIWTSQCWPNKPRPDRNLKVREGQLSVIGKLVPVILALLFSGCTTVNPWERGRLARPEMAWDVDPMLVAHRNHSYFSKEGSNGEASATGGGCGCN